MWNWTWNLHQIPRQNPLCDLKVPTIIDRCKNVALCTNTAAIHKIVVIGPNSSKLYEKLSLEITYLFIQNVYVLILYKSMNIAQLFRNSVILLDCILVIHFVEMGGV